MDLIARSQRPFAWLADIVRHRRRWRTRRREAEALRLILDRTDERLLTDAGIRRDDGHRLLGEKPFFPAREWDRWQL